MPHLVSLPEGPSAIGPSYADPGHGDDRSYSSSPDFCLPSTSSHQTTHTVISLNESGTMVGTIHDTLLPLGG
jgi:hypothetical protein